MPNMTAPTRTNGTKALSAARPAGARGRPAARRRQLPLVVVGVLLVIGGALAFADASLHLGSREEVLVVSEPLAAGQVITSSDLETVRVSTGTGLQVVLAGDEASVVGSPVAVPLVAGSLLTRAEVGSTAPVASGSDVVAVGLKAGHSNQHHQRCDVTSTLVESVDRLIETGQAGDWERQQKQQ